MQNLLLSLLYPKGRFVFVFGFDIGQLLNVGEVHKFVSRNQLGLIWFWAKERVWQQRRRGTTHNSGRDVVGKTEGNKSGLAWARG